MIFNSVELGDSALGATSKSTGYELSQIEKSQFFGSYHRASTTNDCQGSAGNTSSSLKERSKNIFFKLPKCPSPIPPVLNAGDSLGGKVRPRIRVMGTTKANVPPLKIESKPFDKRQLSVKSLTSRLILEAKTYSQSFSYAEYAKYEAAEGAKNTKMFTIVFPFASPVESDEHKVCALNVCIKNHARIGDLIGLSCHIYSRIGRVPPCEHPSKYSLYLTEDDIRFYDAELPPQDRGRFVRDCGFPILTMVRNSELPSNIEDVNIYLVDGRIYTFQVETSDVELQWLFDRALNQKQRDDELLYGKRSNEAVMKGLEYVLEELKTGQKLDLKCTISSTASNDFVLIRLNSARSEELRFENIPALKMQRKRTVNNILTVASSPELIKISSYSNDFGGSIDDEVKRGTLQGNLSQLFPTRLGHQNSILSTDSGAFSAIDSPLFLEENAGEDWLLPAPSLGECTVRRVYRNPFRLKARMKLILTKNYVCIVPSKKSKTRQSKTRNEKDPCEEDMTIRKEASNSGRIIRWEYVIRAEIDKNRPNSRNSTFRLITLRRPYKEEAPQFQEDNGQPKFYLLTTESKDNNFYRESNRNITTIKGQHTKNNIKVLVFDAKVEDGWNMVSKMNKLVESLKSGSHN